MALQEKQNHAIGMFDSGVGGLTVMQEVIRQIPNENIVYFADTARIPYGEKSREAVIRFSVENTAFLIKNSIKLLIVACNTASAHSLDKLKDIFHIPIIGVIEPGADQATKVTKNGKIAVLATRGTVNSGAYQKEIAKKMPEAEVYAFPCPLFVPFVEEKLMHHPAAKLVVKEYLKPVKDKQVDTILLGCTHYPLLKNLIQEEMGEDIAIVDSASTCAKAVKKILIDLKLHTFNNAAPIHRFFVSDDPEKFQSIGSDFLGMPIMAPVLKV